MLTTRWLSRSRGILLFGKYTAIQLQGLAGCCLCFPVVFRFSMGGAIATRMAASGRIPQLHGLMVLDVVEGTKLTESDALVPARTTHNPSLPMARGISELRASFSLVGFRQLNWLGSCDIICSYCAHCAVLFLQGRLWQPCPKWLLLSVGFRACSQAVRRL